MKAYVKPTMDAEIFAANEFIAACNYSGYYLKDTDNDGDFSDEEKQQATYESGTKFDESSASSSFGVMLIKGSRRITDPSNSNYAKSYMNPANWTASTAYVINGEVHVNRADNAS